MCLWIFARVDFQGNTKTKFCRNCEGYHLKSGHVSSAFKNTKVF